MIAFGHIASALTVGGGKTGLLKLGTRTQIRAHMKMVGAGGALMGPMWK